MSEIEFHLDKNRGESVEFSPEEEEAIFEIEQVVKKAMKDMPEHHGIKHVENVRGLARQICKEEGGDLFAVELAALLHELGRKSEKEKKRPHAILSLLEAHDYLKELYERGVINLARWREISPAIAKHSQLGDKTDRLTLDIIRDADRLDAMGLAGILRCFEHSQERGWPFYNSGQKIIFPDDEFVTREVSKSAIGDVNFVRDWRKLMKLDSAKRIAQQRLKPMEDILRLFEKHQGIASYDVWIGFVRSQLIQNRQDVNEEDFQGFLKEYQSEKQ